MELNRAALVILFVSFVAGCAMPQKTSPYLRAQAVPNKAIVYLYRIPTSVDSANPDVPRFYVNGEDLGKLTIGGHYMTMVEPGDIKVFYKDSLFGMPLPWTAQEFQLKAVAGQTYFVKFGTDFGLLKGKTTSFGVVTKEVGEAEIASTQLLKN